MAIISISLGILYAWVHARLLVVWNKMTLGTEIEESSIGDLSIVIPCRNEENNIARCVQAIRKSENITGNIEIIVVDDHSTDSTASVVKALPNVRYVAAPTSQQGKKAALAQGISLATYETIWTTDGDCWIQSKALSNLYTLFQTKQLNLLHGSCLILAQSNTFLSEFQELENAGLMLMVGAGRKKDWIRSANGSNVMFSKSAFDQVDGFAGNEQYASGDDVFLLEKLMALDAKKVYWDHRKSSVVYTGAVEQKDTFWQQRIRWTSKSQGLHHMPTKLFGALHIAYNFWLCCLILFAIWNPGLRIIALLLVAIKLLTDCILLKQASSYFGRIFNLPLFLRSSIFQPYYMLVASFRGLVGKKYDWKGRQQQ